jgi:hypothetical protein
MTGSLKHFSPSDIKLTNDQAAQVFKFFWSDIPPTPLLPSSLTPGEVGFAQALLVEAIDASYSMGFVQHIYDAFFMKVPEDFDSIRDMVKDFLKECAKDWFEHAQGIDFDHPKIYQSVRVNLSRNFRSVWELALSTGDVTY